MQCVALLLPPPPAPSTAESSDFFSVSLLNFPLSHPITPYYFIVLRRLKHLLPYRLKKRITLPRNPDKIWDKSTFGGINQNEDRKLNAGCDFSLSACPERITRGFLYHIPNNNGRQGLAGHNPSPSECATVRPARISLGPVLNKESGIHSLCGIWQFSWLSEVPLRVTTVQIRLTARLMSPTLKVTTTIPAHFRLHPLSSFTQNFFVIKSGRPSVIRASRRGRWVRHALRFFRLQAARRSLQEQ